MNNERDAEIKKRKGVKQRGMIMVVFFLLLGAGIVFVAHSSKSTGFEAPEPVHQAVVVEDPKSTSSALATNPNTTDTQVSSSSSNSDMDVIKAKLCQDVIANARTAAKSYSDQFSQSWKSWKSNYAGRFDDPEAEASKEYYKNLIKSRYSEYIASNNPTMQTACNSKDSLASIMLQPNYDAWQ